MRRILAKHVKNWKGVRSRFHMAHVGLTKFFDVIEHVVQLFLKNFRLGVPTIRFARSSLLYPYARVVRASHAVRLLVALSVVACDEAARSICANDETSPSLARHPKENGKRDGPKEN